MENKNTITTDILNSSQIPIKLPQQQQDLTNFRGITDGVYNTLANEYNVANKNLENLRATQNTTGTDIVKMMEEIAGKTADTVSAEGEAGVNTAQKDFEKYLQTVGDLQAQASVLNREAQAIPIQIQEQFKGTGATDIGVAPIQTAKLRENALKALSIAQQQDIASAALTGSQIRLQAAKDKAQQIIDLKYKPLEDKLAIKKQQYELNKDVLESYDKKRTEALNAKLKEEERILAEQKQTEKDIEKMILEATPNAPANIIANAKAIKEKGGSSIEVAQALGKYGGDYLGNLVKKSQIDENYAQINKIAEEIKKNNISIQTNNLANTNTGVITKLLASAKNNKQLDATERQSLSKARGVINQLDLLQSNIKKQNGTGFIKGTVGNFLEKFGLATDIGVINAQLQAITPNLARGVYGEVGVLTDNDVKLYRTTLPRIDRKEDQNDAILALTLKTVQKAIENTLTGAANSGIDVSGWAEDYSKITKKITDIEDRIGISKAGIDNIVAENKELLPAIKEMYKQGLTDGEILEALNAR